MLNRQIEYLKNELYKSNEINAKLNKNLNEYKNEQIEVKEMISKYRNQLLNIKE